MPKALNTKVGDLRPSQLLLNFGCGSLLDLPHLSVLVMGIDGWDPAQCAEVDEPRLLAAVKKQLGAQVKRLLLPPQVTDDSIAAPDPYEQSRVGIPVAPFPQWMRCPWCDRVAPLEAGYFELKADPYRPERNCYVHANCNKANKPPVVPVRFLVACNDGHLDDFPWVEYVHRGPCQCRPIALRLYEVGASGDASDIRVKCETCGHERSMSDAFGEDAAQHLPSCRGWHPHIRTTQDHQCQKQAKTILLGASNAWFPITLSALAIPRSADRLAQLVDENWGTLDKAGSVEVLQAFREIGQLSELTEYSDGQIWGAMQERRLATSVADAAPFVDLRAPEWEVLSSPGTAPRSRDFLVRAVDLPAGYERFFSQVVLVERVREVRALTGFTRLEPPDDPTDPAQNPTVARAPISRRPPAWVPTSEMRGEGLFLQFSEDALAAWCGQGLAVSREREFLEAHTKWRSARNITPPEASFPGIRYVLLHSFSHALMRQLSLECGYTAASIRERIYARPPQDAGGAMAGVLIYTSAPDSEGTLGGLVLLGEPTELRRHVAQSLAQVGVCASDPLCAEHAPPKEGVTLHGAACHACLFAPETSCEKGNRYLDRATLVSTFAEERFGFFEQG